MKTRRIKAAIITRRTRTIIATTTATPTTITRTITRIITGKHNKNKTIKKHKTN